MKLFFFRRLYILMLIVSIGITDSLNAQNLFPSSGNVGIGTNSPAMPLHVIGESWYTQKDSANFWL